MSYQPPLTERIKIQLEIFCENTSDCISSLSSNYKRPILFLVSCALLLTLRSARRGIKGVSSGLYGSGSSLFGSGGTGSSLYGGGGGSGSSLYGGGSSTYSSGGLMGSSSSSMYGGGLRGGTSIGMGGSTYGAGSTYGGAASSSMGSYVSSSLGGGKTTAILADSNPTSIVTLDPSIRLYDYGGSTDFYGQIEIVQAFDAPSFVSQIISQPGQSKVLIIDGGGSLQSAIFDSEMANTAMRNGWKGVIVHGAIRNASQLGKVPFGVKALGTNPMKGSSQIQSGWWVYADGDGVVMSQSDISGGSFGGGGGGGSSSMGIVGSGTMGGYGASSSMTGGMTGGYGASSSLSGGYGSSSMTGGYGSTTGGYGSSTGGIGSSLTGGYGSSSMGSGSTYGSGSSLAGGYGGSSSLYGGYGSSSSPPYSYGKGSLYGSSSQKKKKNKMFKIMLATSIAAIVWLVCLR
ncbi:predicted protein [Thalassiosira pseudonana CCMP1335]|uniref:4-hydroxy-4-methyl-2-oxoglutarate aldolase n=1 Tax=Thalassiosira pseudonana TaxID=35128 RepID=B8C0Q9_THAPS|nr:predicted protein [Thalassiosira pseudonana CCMP1335]EED93558.1 predicted protein [Thalassiosira pseudonana CCMP1335]